MAGFIYIMSNPAFPNLLKIGKSKKDPTTDRLRAIQEAQDRKQQLQERIEAGNRLEASEKFDTRFKLFIIGMACIFFLAKVLSD
jgi:hypothetical protein